jgi:hypothetical protein
MRNATAVVRVFDEPEISTARTSTGGGQPNAWCYTASTYMDANVDGGTLYDMDTQIIEASGTGLAVDAIVTLTNYSGVDVLLNFGGYFVVDGNVLSHRSAIADTNTTTLLDGGTIQLNAMCIVDAPTESIGFQVFSYNGALSVDITLRAIDVMRQTDPCCVVPPPQ